MRIIIIIVSLAVSALALGQAVPATAPVPRVVFPVTTSGTSLTVGAVTANAANAANFSFGAAANGSVFANTGSRLPTAGGASVDVTVSSTIPKAKIAKSFSALLGKSLPAVAVAKSYYDLVREIRDIWTTEPDGNGNMTVVERMTGVGYKVGNSGCMSGTADSVCKAYNGGTGGAGAGGSICYGWMGYSQTPMSQCTISPAPRDVTAAEVEAAINAKADYNPTTSALPTAVKQLIDAGVNFDAQPTTITGPASEVVAVEKKTDPATGNVTTSTTTNFYTYNGPTFSTTQNTTHVTHNPAGVVVGTPTTDTSTVAPDKPTPEADIKTCGYPGGPPCKIDESGTTDGRESDASAQAAKDAIKPMTDFAKAPSTFFPAMPQLSWTFALPTGCGVIPTPQFAPFFVSIDICPWQATFHQIMTIVWSLGGLFGAIQLFMKSALKE